MNSSMKRNLILCGLSVAMLAGYTVKEILKSRRDNTDPSEYRVSKDGGQPELTKILEQYEIYDLVPDYRAADYSKHIYHYVYYAVDYKDPTNAFFLADLEINEDQMTKAFTYYNVDQVVDLSREDGMKEGFHIYKTFYDDLAVQMESEWNQKAYDANIAPTPENFVLTFSAGKTYTIDTSIYKEDEELQRNFVNVEDWLTTCARERKAYSLSSDLANDQEYGYQGPETIGNVSVRTIQDVRWEEGTLVVCFAENKETTLDQVLVDMNLDPQTYVAPVDSYDYQEDLEDPCDFSTSEEFLYNNLQFFATERDAYDYYYDYGDQ